MILLQKFYNGFIYKYNIQFSEYILNQFDFKRIIEKITDFFNNNKALKLRKSKDQWKKDTIIFGVT